jgi:hypothetical protein
MATRHAESHDRQDSTWQAWQWRMPETQDCRRRAATCQHPEGYLHWLVCSLESKGAGCESVRAMQGATFQHRENSACLCHAMRGTSLQVNVAVL